MTYGELFDKHVKPFSAALEKYSKTALLQVLADNTWIHATRWSTSETFEADVERALAEVLEQLKKTAPIAAGNNKSKRVRALLDRIARARIEGADCNTCEHWRERKAKKKGTRIPGGVGKCTRPEGHCRPSKVRLQWRSEP
jgi:hypothetical protein